MSRVRFTEWGGSAGGTFLLPDNLVMWGLPPIFTGRGLSSLPTCSLTYQQGKQWCWWHLPFKHFIVCKERSYPSPYLSPFPILRRYLNRINSQLLRFKDEKWIVSFSEDSKKKKKSNNNSIFPSFGVFFPPKNSKHIIPILFFPPKVLNLTSSKRPFLPTQYSELTQCTHCTRHCFKPFPYINSI